MINKIAVIGAGVIGSGWVVRFLAHNKKVIVYDTDPKLKKKSYERGRRPKRGRRPILERFSAVCGRQNFSVRFRRGCG